MNKITLTFSPEELRELAKLVYMGTFFTIDTGYDNEAMANDIFNRICEMGLLYANDTGSFMEGGPLEITKYTVTEDLDDECSPLIDLFQEDSVYSVLPYLLSDRDFMEQYGVMEPEEVINNPELMTVLLAIQEKYINEISTYSVTHLRLEERE